MDLRSVIVAPMSGGADRPARRDLGAPAAIAGGLAATAIASLGAWLALRLAVRCLRLARTTARFTVALATFRLYRRCPDCRRLKRADARVCHRCGYRRPDRTTRRSGRR